MWNSLGDWLDWLADTTIMVTASICFIGMFGWLLWILLEMSGVV